MQLPIPTPLGNFKLIDKKNHIQKNKNSAAHSYSITLDYIPSNKPSPVTGWYNHAHPGIQDAAKF